MRMTMFRCLILASLLVLPFLCFIPGQASADPVGACCLVSTCSCQVLDQATCVSQGGAYYGDGTNCDPNPCSFAAGACCLHDGSCIIACPYDCTTHEGVFYGYGQSCNPNPCPPCLLPCSSGACCFVDGRCEITLQQPCQAENGVWQGIDTTCNPNPCGTSSVLEMRTEIRSWGKIKSIYR